MVTGARVRAATDNPPRVPHLGAHGRRRTRSRRGRPRAVADARCSRLCSECAGCGPPAERRGGQVTDPYRPSPGGPRSRAPAAGAGSSTAMTAWLSVLVPLLVMFFALGMERVESRLRESAVRQDELEELLEQPRPDEVRALFRSGTNRAGDVPAAPRRARPPPGPAEQGLVLTAGSGTPRGAVHRSAEDCRRRCSTRCTCTLDWRVNDPSQAAGGRTRSGEVDEV